MFYARLPTDEELSNSGFVREDYEEEAEVWPENWPAFDLLVTMSTQWNVCMGVLVGMQYSVLFSLLDRMGLSRDEWESLFQDVRIMERAAIESSKA